MQRDGRSSLTSFVRTMSTEVKALASDMHLAELLACIRGGDTAGASKSAEQCKRLGVLDSRCANHGACGQFALRAPPLWLAVYQQDESLVEALLRHGAAPDATSSTCPGNGRSCALRKGELLLACCNI